MTTVKHNTDIIKYAKFITNLLQSQLVKIQVSILSIAMISARDVKQSSNFRFYNSNCIYSVFESWIKLCPLFLCSNDRQRLFCLCLEHCTLRVTELILFQKWCRVDYASDKLISKK